MTGKGHYRRTGGPKLSFATEAEAWDAARKVNAEEGTRCRPYRCRDRRYPPYFHVGHRRRRPPSGSPDRVPEWELELGVRATGCLGAENHPLAARRRAHVLKALASTRRRRKAGRTGPP